MGKIKDLTGQRFCRLTVVKYSGKNKYDKVLWQRKCDCGNEKIIMADSLRSGKTKSCGCLNIDKIIERNTKHGLSRTKIYKTWCGMKARCYNKNDAHYKYYGGRGIKMCDEWLNKFMSFYNWAIKNGYEEGLTIDRINVNGDYEPSNCRWTTSYEQMRNYRRNYFITYNGETLCLKDLAKKYNIPEYKLSRKLKKGLSIEEIMKL